MAQHAQPVLGPAGCRDLLHAQWLLHLRRLARSERRVVRCLSRPKRQSERRVAHRRCDAGRAHLLGRARRTQLRDEAQEEVERAVVAAVEADEQLEWSVLIEPLREQVEHRDGQPRHRIVHGQDHAELDRGRSCRGGHAECGQRRGGGGRVADARVVAHLPRERVPEERKTGRDPNGRRSGASGGVQRTVSTHAARAPRQSKPDSPPWTAKYLVGPHLTTDRPSASAPAAARSSWAWRWSAPPSRRATVLAVLPSRWPAARPAAARARAAVQPPARAVCRSAAGPRWRWPVRWPRTRAAPADPAPY
eukprot:scaffold36505_cov54-Phaeocystis_antarctica.AAC.2